MNDQTRDDDLQRILQLLKSEGGRGDSVSEDDIALGRVAMERNLLSADQLTQAAQELAATRARGETPSLSTIILQHGWIQADDLLHLAAEQARHSAAAPKLTRYEIHECRGEGASAVVYRAWDRELKRLVALKVLRAAAGMSGIARNRFKREATAAANLVHPNVVAVYDAAEEEGRPYLVMEFIEGRTLHSVLAEGKTPRKGLVELLEQAARGVAAAHEKGIVHRDLKPANILVTPDRVAKVADFGLAHLMDSDSALTRSGAELGTPSYMSPEQVDGRSKESTPATDVFALGAILYEILSGAPPHDRPSLQETFAAILSQDPPAPRSIDPKIPTDLETICLKALEKDPQRRYPSAREFADDVHAYLSGEFIAAVPISRWRRRLQRAMKNRTLIAAALLLLIVSAGAAAILVRQSATSQAKLTAERDLSRRREAALQRLGSVQSTILERDRELRLQRVPAAQARRDLEAALLEVDRFVKEWPDYPQGYYVRARGKMLLGDLPGAERDLHSAVAKEPEFRPGWSLLGLLKVGEYQSQLEGPRLTFDERLQSLAPLLEEAKQHFSKGWTPGKELEESARWGLAWTREDQVSERLSRAFKLYYYDRNHDGAIALLEEGDKEYQAEEYAMWIGLIHPDPKVKIERLNQAIQRAPGYLPAHYQHGTRALRSGDWRSALADFDRVLAGHPSAASAYDMRSEAKRNLQDLEGALADTNRAIELNPKLQVAWLHRGAILGQQGKKAESLADFDRAIELIPQSAEAIANRGIAKFRFEDLPGALADFNRALQLDPNRAYMYRYRATISFRSGKLREAILDLDRAIQLEPASYVAFELRGVARGDAGDLAGAIRDLEEALHLAPADWQRRADCENELKAARARLKAKKE